jgi:hypothetical protein
MLLGATFEGLEGVLPGIVNPSFDEGLNGWTVGGDNAVQNVTGPIQNLRGLNVRRSFYAVPNRLWARVVDTFENPTAAPITATLQYETYLGSEGDGVIYSPDGNNRSLASWDGLGLDRDLGLVFGDMDVAYESATDVDPTFALVPGNALVTSARTVTIAPGATVALVHFLVLNTDVTADVATDETTRIMVIDTVINDILSHYQSDGQYRTGMTQEQIDAVINFP